MPLSPLAAAVEIARKDLRVEFRSRTTFAAAAVFAVIAAAVFNFAWDPTAVAATDIAPGAVWVNVVLAVLLALHRSFAMERESSAIDALVAAPISRRAIFAGKFAASLAFVVLVEVVVWGAVVLLYDVRLGGAVWALAAVGVAAAIALAAVGTVFGSMSANTRLGEMLLPVIALPFFLPVVAAASQTTAKLLAGRPPAELIPWLQLLAAFDLTFLFACAAIFPFTLDE